MEREFIDWLGELRWIQPGDCVYVVSDMLGLARAYKELGRKLVTDDVVEGLQKLVGEEGTLLFPAFNWDFCKGIPFDYYKTPVRTGALPKAALKRPDFARTSHPLYSFAVWGARREELLADQSVDAFGPGTIFEKMYEWKAKVLVLGLEPLRGITYIHHVEKMTGVPYRYDKEFTADYTDALGRCGRRTCRMYVRDLEMDPRHIDGFAPLARQMREEGLIRTAAYEGVDCHLVLIEDLDREVRKDILENDSRNLYRYNKVSGSPL